MNATSVRPEIQALRAIAVGVVVVCHFWPSALPGGFVGVDVFFVISGFLITTLLMRELRETGRVSLRGFWARRARRILPAALVVLAFCAAGTALWVPDVNWEQFFAEIRASAFYVQNCAATCVARRAAFSRPRPRPACRVSPSFARRMGRPLACSPGVLCAARAAAPGRCSWMNPR